MLLKKDTARTRVFSFASVTGTLAVTVSKAGAAFASPSGTLTQITGTYYALALAAGDTNTLGDLAYKFTDNSGTIFPHGDTVDEVVTGIVGEGATGALETGYSSADLLKLISAATLGRVSISNNIVTIRDVNNTADRIVATVDDDGQRTSVVLTP